MRRAITTAALLTLGCGAAVRVPSAAIDPERAALVATLCAPLPAAAFDCVVGWPASVPPARRDAVRAASGGASWASAPGVRAYASCSDRPAEDGPVAHVVTLLVDTGVGSAEEIAERLPVRVRWSEECDEEPDDCATYYARAEGDLLILARRVQRPMTVSEDVASLACAAIADGAVEAHVRLDGYGALVQALALDATGVTTTFRRPARGESERTHRTWTELDLGALDDELEHDADVRAAAMSRPMDPEDVDVVSGDVLDLQLAARQRRVLRDPSADQYRLLARLAARGFEAHPSRPELGVLAIDAYLLAHEPEPARPVLAALEAIVGADDADARRLAAAIECVAGDTGALAARLGPLAPELDDAARLEVAGALVAELATRPLAADASLPAMTTALLAAARAGRVGLTPRAPATLRPARGAPWAILAASTGAATRVIVQCGEATLPTVVATAPSSRGPVGVAALGECSALVLPEATRLEPGVALMGTLSASVHGRVRVFVEVDGALSGVAGTVSDGSLRADASTPSLVHADLARAQREVVAPLDAVGTRVFPTPTLTLPIPTPRREAAAAALERIESVSCRSTADGLACTPASYESSEGLAEAAFAAFAATP